MSEFDEIDSRDGWRDKLKSLLELSQAAAAGEEVQPRVALAERLTQFVEHSFPNDAAVRALDKVAKEAAVGLLDKTIEERLQSIVATNAELAGLTKSFEAEASHAKKVASDLRLERALKAVDALNSGIAALKELASGLEAGADDVLLKNVNQTVDAAKKLRALLESS